MRLKYASAANSNTEMIALSNEHGLHALGIPTATNHFLYRIVNSVRYKIRLF